MFGGAFSFDFGAPRKLFEVSRRLNDRSLKARPLEPKDDLNRVVERFYKQQWPTESRRRRDYRLLPWALKYGAPPLFSSSKLLGLLDELSDSPRPSQILGMVDSYLNLTFDEAKRHGKAVRNWIIQQIKAFPGRNPRVLGWRPYLELLENPGSEKVAQQWAQAPDLQAWLRQLPFPVSSHLTQSLLEATALEFGHRHYQRTEEFLELLQTTVKPAIGEKTRIFDRLLKAIARHHSAEPRTSIINYALMEFGDPHLDSRQRWHYFSQEGRQMIVQWISAEDLRLFFDEITGDQAGRERRLFWRDYLDERHVGYSKIVLSALDRDRASTTLRKHLATGRHGVIKGQSKASAFILRIGRYYFVEFSGINNACYVYTADYFTTAFLSKKHYAIGELKNQDLFLLRLSHTPNWQARFDEEIYRLTGIRVSRHAPRSGFGSRRY